MSNSYVWILSRLQFIDRPRASAESYVVSASTNANIIYKEACKIIMEELVREHGQPHKIETNDELDDDKVFINQIVLSINEIYTDTRRYTSEENSTNAGKLKMNWAERYRRIDNAYEKLRPEPKNNDMCGTYYKISRHQVMRPIKSL